MKANLTTICNSAAQEEIRAFLTHFLEGVFPSESELQQLILALDEAVSNAIIHGNDSDPERTIQLDIDVDEKRVHTEISDIGLFDDIVKGKKEKKGKDLKSIIKEKQRGGLGLKLIYSIMDIVAFYTKDNQSHIMMVKLLQSPSKAKAKSEKDWHFLAKPVTTLNNFIFP